MAEFGVQSDTPHRKEFMKKQIARISILQSSKIMTALYTLFGFIYTLIGIPMILFGNQQLHLMGWIYIAMPLVTLVFGFIFFVLFAAIYNGLAKWLGGVEFEATSPEDHPPLP
jgi:hypothetical protein